MLPVGFGGPEAVSILLLRIFLVSGRSHFFEKQNDVAALLIGVLQAMQTVEVSAARVGP